MAWQRRPYRRDYVSANGFSPETNRFVGRTSFTVIFLGVTWISYQIWKEKMFSEEWFYIAQIVAFFLVKFILRDVLKFWKY